MNEHADLPYGAIAEEELLKGTSVLSQYLRQLVFLVGAYFDHSVRQKADGAVGIMFQMAIRTTHKLANGKASRQH